MTPLLYFVQKELRQVFRDRAMLRIIFGVPIIQLFIFAYAANLDLKNVRLAVLDEDASRPSRRLVEALVESDVFVTGPAAARPEDLQSFLVHDKADVSLWIPRGFEHDLLKSHTAEVGIAVDGQNSALAGRAAGYASAIVARELSRAAAEGDATAYAARGGASPRGGITAVTRFFYNPQLESRLYMVPGILVLLITVISTMLTSMAVVREREMGTLEQLLVTPLTPAQHIAGKTIPFVIITFADFIIATVVAITWFRLPFLGSVPLLIVGAAAYLLVTLGVGLLASTVSSTQQQAMFTVWFFLVFGIMTSGFFFPVDNMPAWSQWLPAINPLRYMMDIIRGVFLKGAGFRDMGLELAILLIMGVGVFSAAILRFQKRIA
jgi:ABC-2 type transport system permease protein